jgi:hypothetical protein
VAHGKLPETEVTMGEAEKPRALWRSARAQSIVEAATADFRVSSVAFLLHF